MCSYYIKFLIMHMFMPTKCLAYETQYIQIKINISGNIPD